MLSFLQSITLTILLAFLLRAFVLQPFIVEGQSMEPNFHDREYIIIDKFSYHIRQPERGEVIVFHPPTAPDQNYIKRIIGLPGDSVKIDRTAVYVNGTKLNEPYLSQDALQNDVFNTEVNTKLSQGQYFVLGDNRNHSSDSREWGILPAQNIEGRTWLVVLPFNDFHVVQKPTYGSLVGWLDTMSHLAQGLEHAI